MTQVKQDQSMICLSYFTNTKFFSRIRPHGANRKGRGFTTVVYVTSSHLNPTKPPNLNLVHPVCVVANSHTWLSLNCSCQHGHCSLLAWFTEILFRNAWKKCHSNKDWYFTNSLKNPSSPLMKSILGNLIIILAKYYINTINQLYRLPSCHTFKVTDL